MDLADRIIRGAKDRDTHDELGLPLNAKGEVDYLVARILMRNPDLYIDPLDNKFYIGTHEVTMTQNKLVELANSYNDWCKGGRWPLIVNRLREFTPRLDRSKLYISEHLMWDYDKHRLIRRGYGRFS